MRSNPAVTFVACLALLAARGGVALACPPSEGEATRTRIQSTDPAGEFVVELEGSRVVKVVIDGEEVPEDRIRREDGCCSVADAHGATVLELRADVDGALRWKTRKPRVTVGLTMGDLDEALASHLGIEREAAVLITDVAEGGPAARAGLERFDVVLSVDGASPATREALLEAVARKSAGDELALEVRRGASRRTIAVPVESERRFDRTSRVPILGDLPLIGAFYTRTRSDLPISDFYVRHYVNDLATADDAARNDADSRWKAIEDRLARIEALLEERAPR